ncbi:MAG TPA: DUF4411 family protein [Arachidicoccus soli]|nr:DUF4411 family protein [Arachidicoccus soli]
MTSYIIDANILIQAHRRLYPLDVFIGFWNQITSLAHSGVIESIDKVKKEIIGKNDLLETWCVGHLPATFFKDSSTCMSQYADVCKWAISRKSHYKPTALAEFLHHDEADAFIVAHGIFGGNNKIIVTEEISEPLGKKKVKIPEPCNHFNLQYINTIEMFRRLQITI